MSSLSMRNYMLFIIQGSKPGTCWYVPQNDSAHTQLTLIIHVNTRILPEEVRSLLLHLLHSLNLWSLWALPYGGLNGGINPCWLQTILWYDHIIQKWIIWAQCCMSWICPIQSWRESFQGREHTVGHFDVPSIWRDSGQTHMGSYWLVHSGLWVDFMAMDIYRTQLEKWSKWILGVRCRQSS